MGVRIIWRCFFEIKYVHAKRAEERTLRVFLCPFAGDWESAEKLLIVPSRRPCGGVQRESRRHGTVRWARRSRARTSEPPLSNRGVQIGQDRRTTQNFVQNQSETEVKLQNKTWIMEFQAKRMQIDNGILPPIGAGKPIRAAKGTQAAERRAYPAAP